MLSYTLFFIFSILFLSGLFFLRKRFKSTIIRSGMVGLQALYAMFLIFLFEAPLQNFKYSLHALVSNEYQKNVELIQPYFDEEFYLSRYGDMVEQSGLSSIDHFLQRGWHTADWSKHTDPNPWFNTTLYQERLWPRKISRLSVDVNPFVDFLRQPKVKTQPETIQIYATETELERAFYAVEGVLRLGKFNVELHVPESVTSVELKRFEPQVLRGLELKKDNLHGKSFYQSEFLNSPERFIGVTPQYAGEAKQRERTSYVRGEYPYTLHKVYHGGGWKRSGWFKKGHINPMLINIAHACDEPLIFMGYSVGQGSLVSNLRKFILNVLDGRSESSNQSTLEDFKAYMVRIASGFDLCLFNTKLPIDNLKLIPGYMYSWVDEAEIDAEKKFEASFLLSLGQSLGKCDLKSYRSEGGFKYAARIDVWNYEEDFKIPTKFYVSARDKETFPESLQNRALPTDSKKWLFGSQYHIAIENSRQEDYFTEKVLDCFISMTVPIYLGCPNIGDYFDVRGMIIVNSPEEIVEVANSLTPETYQTMLPYMKENYKRAKKFLTIEEDAIRELGEKMQS